ncbi:MAG: hypothetical protein Q9168_007710 [Polycauliona sp. 1 TL-2023]
MAEQAICSTAFFFSGGVVDLRMRRCMQKMLRARDRRFARSGGGLFSWLGVGFQAAIVVCEKQKTKENELQAACTYNHTYDWNPFIFVWHDGHLYDVCRWLLGGHPFGRPSGRLNVVALSLLF